MTRRRRKTRTKVFTLDQLRDKGWSDRIAAAAREPNGCVIVRENGSRVGSMRIPQEPLECDCDDD